MFLHYHSTAINQIFIVSEAGANQEKSSMGIPPAIMEALTTCAPDYSRAWTTLAPL